MRVQLDCSFYIQYNLAIGASDELCSDSIPNGAMHGMHFCELVTPAQPNETLQPFPPSWRTIHKNWFTIALGKSRQKAMYQCVIIEINFHNPGISQQELLILVSTCSGQQTELQRRVTIVIGH